MGPFKSSDGTWVVSNSYVGQKGYEYGCTMWMKGGTMAITNPSVHVVKRVAGPLS